MENFGRTLGTSAKRELIAIALRGHPESSHRDIAKLLGVSPSRVDQVWREVRNATNPSSFKLIIPNETWFSAAQPRRVLALLIPLACERSWRPLSTPGMGDRLGVKVPWRKRWC
jgi:hypothetical protein